MLPFGTPVDKALFTDTELAFGPPPMTEAFWEYVSRMESLRDLFIGLFSSKTEGRDSMARPPEPTTDSGPERCES